MVVSLPRTRRRAAAEHQQVALARLRACTPPPGSWAGEPALPPGSSARRPATVQDDAVSVHRVPDDPEPMVADSVEIPPSPSVLCAIASAPQAATGESDDGEPGETEGEPPVQHEGPPGDGRPQRPYGLAEWLEGKVPVSVRGGLIDPGRRAVGALAVAGLIAALVAGVYFWRSRPEPVTLSPRQVAAASASGQASVAPVTPTLSSAALSPRASPTPVTSATAVVVDVGGKVRDPGVYTLPSGSRVIDAVEAAGGVEEGAKTAGVNLARLVVDGEKILVGVPRPPGLMAAPGGAPQAGGSTASVLDLNTATAEQFEELPGIGPVLSQRIVDYRTEHGGFGAVTELKDVSGIGEATFADLEDRVTV